MPSINIYALQTFTLTIYPAPIDQTNLIKWAATLRAFPPGEYFNRSDGWVPGMTRGIARTLSRFFIRVGAFHRQMDPRTADELLDEWERCFGLETDSMSLEDRRDAVLAKIRSLGGVTAEYYEGVAISFGYADAVVTAAADPFTTLSLCDDFLQDGEWKVTMQVTAASQGAARDQALQDLLNSQLLAGFFAIYTFT